MIELIMCTYNFTKTDISFINYILKFRISLAKELYLNEKRVECGALNCITML